MYFCKNCGEPYMTDEAVMCVKCGVSKGQGSNYCHNCGKSFYVIEKESEVQNDEIQKETCCSRSLSDR